MVDFKRILYGKTNIVKCHKCGKTIEVPNMYNDKVRKKVLSPYCISAILFSEQWLMYHGWHIRNLGVTDCNPYICPDCWVEGTPEYSKSAEGKQWCEQAEEWRKEQVK